MDFNSHTPPSNDEVMAPDSLITGIKQRIEKYRTGYTKENEQDRVLDDPRWEVRCALLEQTDLPFYQVQKALDDENTFVRMAAIRALGRSHRNIPIATELLQRMQQDDEWLVRETALLTMRIANVPVSATMWEAYLCDPNREVRETAIWIQHLAEVKQANPVKQQAQLSSLSMKEIFQMGTEHITRDTQETFTQKSVSAMTSKLPSIRRKQTRGIRIGLLVVTAVLFLASLTAAGFSLGWWNTFFGNPDVYQQIGIQQSSHGVILRVTRVYADEGRTVIAYDIVMSDKTKAGMVGTYDLSGSFSQKQVPLQETQCSAPQDGVQHCYLLYPAFNVSPQSNQFNLTWDVTRILVSQPGNSSRPSSITGNWDFKFSLPFHQTNNHQLPDPITGETIKG